MSRLGRPRVTVDGARLTLRLRPEEVTAVDEAAEPGESRVATLRRLLTRAIVGRWTSTPPPAVRAGVRVDVHLERTDLATARALATEAGLPVAEYLRGMLGVDRG